MMLMETLQAKNHNPILDRQLYNDKFPGGEVKKLGANIIAKTNFAHYNVDDDQYLLLKSFVNHRTCNKALSVDGQMIAAKAKSTASLENCCKCKDDSTSWEIFSNL